MPKYSPVVTRSFAEEFAGYFIEGGKNYYPAPTNSLMDSREELPIAPGVFEP